MGRDRLALDDLFRPARRNRQPRWVYFAEGALVGALVSVGVILLTMTHNVPL